MAREVEMPATNESPLLSLTEVGKTYADGTVAFQDVSFTLDRGEFITIVGPSGCGKTSLLRTASGLMKPSTGVLERDADLGFVFQDASLLPWRTVQKNVELLVELRGIKGRSAAVAEALEIVQLSDFADRYPHQLSGGMRMRASLARWLVLDPQLFLFDEPFGALDEITRELLQVELSRLFSTGRIHGGLFITHSIMEAVFISTRVMVMSRRPGEICAEFEIPFEWPRPAELRFDPAYNALCAEVSEALKEAYR